MNTFHSELTEDNAEAKPGIEKKTVSSPASEDERKNKDGETIEETENKNGDAAEEAKEGDFGKRSYASPDFDKEDDG